MLGAKEAVRQKYRVRTREQIRFDHRLRHFRYHIRLQGSQFLGFLRTALGCIHRGGTKEFWARRRGGGHDISQRRRHRTSRSQLEHGCELHRRQKDGTGTGGSNINVNVWSRATTSRGTCGRCCGWLAAHFCLPQPTLHGDPAACRLTGLLVAGIIIASIQLSFLCRARTNIKSIVHTTGTSRTGYTGTFLGARSSLAQKMRFGSIIRVVYVWIGTCTYPQPKFKQTAPIVLRRLLLFIPREALGLLIMS
jgi:hypothetical protein